MRTDELNEYIKHYLEEDKTHSAILLTAPWGTGKSYYIQNTLAPFIDSEEEKKCIIVSLYGLNEIREISKAIYMEVRAKALIKKSEKLSAGKLIGKTVIKGVASFFNVDLSVSDEDLQKLYESIDLTGKLIILEDLERTGIDIIELLGYVNSLVEQDEVKVLLVANEDEMLKTEQQQDEEDDEVVELVKKYSEQKEKKINLSPSARNYLRVKEKTVSDTIRFEAPLETSITQIMQSFHCYYFNDFLCLKDERGESAIVKEIVGWWKHEEQKYNLRSFIFACQKTKDILMSTNEDMNKDFVKSLFIDNIEFAIKFKSLDNINWKKLHHAEALKKFGCPRFDINYKYIFNHSINVEELKQTEKEYLQGKRIHEEHMAHDKDFQTLRGFLYGTEEDVVNVIKRIRDRLKNTDEIPIATFGELANYIIAVKHVVSCNDEINECKKLMLDKLRATDTDVKMHIQYHSGIELWKDEQKNEYTEFTQMMIDANAERNNRMISFDYSIEHLSEFANSLYDYQIKHQTNGPPIILDAERIIDMLKHCNSVQIHVVRGIYREAYGDSYGYLTDKIKNVIIETRDRIKTELINFDGYDGIQKMQIYWLWNDLDRLSNSLEV